MSRPIRYVMDEHVLRAVADGLRKRGVAVTTIEEAGLLGADDEEAYVQALAFEPGETSFFTGVETAAQGGNSIQVSGGASASAVFVAKTGGQSPANPDEFAGAYGFAGGSGSYDLGGASVGGNIEISRSTGGAYTTFEIGASITAGPNLPGFLSTGPSGVGEGGGGGSTFLGTYPISLSQVILP